MSTEGQKLDMAVAGAHSKASSILAVDDTHENLNLLCGMLRERGYRVRPVMSGEQALRAAEAEPPDLILLDVGMPDMDGFEVCARLKADPRLKDVPVIFLSAHLGTEDKVKAFSLGGVDYVTKPFQFDEVHARVATQLEVVAQRRHLQEALDRLRELERLRDDLARWIVHDMRTPLTALIGSLSILKRGVEGRIEAESRRDIERALESARRLGGMANDLLDVSRLEEGRMPLVMGECDLRQTIDGALANVEGMADDVTVRVEASPNVGVQCDAQVVRRVLENLLSNALKHSPPGGTVHVVAEAVGEGVRVAVRDEGQGVPRALRAKVFEKFGGIAGGRQRYHSAGLGLAFCKLAVEAHGGRIGVNGEEGEGGEFWFVLPR